MKEFRITKYDPQNRDSSGAYLDPDEWICFSEVGENVTLEEYEKVEQSYIKAAVNFLSKEIKNLKAIGIENGQKEDISELHQPITEESFKVILKNMLRNKYWCKLQSSRGFLHIGWDYYMYIGCEEVTKEVIEETELSGLFVENMRSPYWEKC